MNYFHWGYDFSLILMCCFSIVLHKLQIWILLNKYKEIRKKNDGLQPKYRFGFSYISMKEMSQKIKRLAKVQIWISLNSYREIGKKNDGLELKYRCGFC